MTPRPADKNGKPKDLPFPGGFIGYMLYAFAVLFVGIATMSKLGFFATAKPTTSAKTRYELSLERDNAELRETNQAYQRALRTALDDAKAITDRFSRTVFPVEDQKFLVDLLTKENEQLREDKAVEIEKRLIMAREAAWIEKNGGEIVAVPVLEENAE